MDQIVKFAWANIREPGVADGLAEAIVSRLDLHDYSILGSDEEREFQSNIETDQERRRLLLTAILSRLDLSRVTAFLTAGMRFLVASDVEWLIDRVLSGGTEELNRVEARLIRFAFDMTDQNTIWKLWLACQRNSILRVWVFVRPNRSGLRASQDSARRLSTREGGEGPETHHSAAC
jgi:hypothetical protein